VSTGAGQLPPFPHAEAVKAGWPRSVVDYLLMLSDVGQRLTTFGTRMPTMTAPPADPQNGDLIYADGTSWNPGSGEGIYAYENGAWVKFQQNP